MITFDVKLEGADPQIHVKIPMDEYLLDDEQFQQAKETIKGIINLVGRAYDSRLFINDQPSHLDQLADIVERYRSLYLLSLFSEVLDRVKPLNDPHVSAIVEKVEPLIERQAEVHQAQASILGGRGVATRS